MTKTAGREAEHVRVIRVFVSSPGDVREEREVLSEVAERINDTDGRRDGVRLELHRWEKNVVPRIGPAPQENVDDQTDPYDVYLGIMASRFGTPTEEWGSGTEEEFRAALAAWREHGAPWILFYFRDDPPYERTAEGLRQFTQVVEFQEELRTLGISGSYLGVRGSKDAFFEKVEMHVRGVLQSIVEKPTADGGGASKERSGRAPSATPTVPEAYRRWLQTECADIDLLGMRLKEGRAARLRSVYVPLVTSLPRLDDESGEAGLDTGLRRASLGSERDDPQLLLRHLDEHSLVVTGPPGSGKSTFCRWVAWLTSTQAMPIHPVDGPREYVESYPERLRGRLPLLVRLRDFWTHLPATPGGDALGIDQLEAALARWVDGTRPGHLRWSDVAEHLEHGSALLIFDGLDEVPLSRFLGRAASHPRSMLLSGLASALPVWHEAGHRVVLTSRPYGIDDDDARKLGLRAVPVADLPDPLRALLVRRWFHILRGTEEEAERLAGDLLRDLESRPELQPLAVNPMLLTAVCIVYNEGKRLPQDKYDLYARIVDGVLYSRYRSDPTEMELVRNRLAAIAHGMHTGAGLGEDRDTPHAEATHAEVDRILQAYRDESPETETGVRGTVEIREDLLSRSGLLLPREDAKAGFHHLSFQEFLAAQRLLDLEFDDLAGAFVARAGREAWRNTLSFLFACLVHKFTARRGVRLVEDLIGRLGDDSHGLAVVVGDALQLLLARRVELSAATIDAYRRVCIAAIEAEAPLRQRHSLGLALGRVGDPRVVTDLRDEAAYCEVPAGSHLVGDEPHPVTIDAPFLLSRYPVTNAQFALFRNEGGYENDRCWSEAGRTWRDEQGEREPEYWRNARWNAPNQPVVGVSFWEAQACAGWAGGRLPDGQEWEAAARGTDGRQYPWGDVWEDGICNTSETRLGTATSVGLFIRSRSPSDLDDMAGNVWEWCETDERGGHESSPVRVLRGGSWIDSSRYARCAFRDDIRPDGRVGSVGFRVLRVGVRTRNG